MTGKIYILVKQNYAHSEGYTQAQTKGQTSAIPDHQMQASRFYF